MTDPDPSYILDGSNIVRTYPTGDSVCLCPLIATICAIISNNETFYCYFDANIQYLLAEKNAAQVSTFNLMLKNYPQYFQLVPAGSRADGYILRHADYCGSRVISNDTYKNKRKEYPWLSDPDRLVKGKVFAKKLNVEVLDLIQPVPELLEIFERFVELEKTLDTRKSKQGDEKAMTSFVPPENARHLPLEGRLIVFALDASGSMVNPDEGACNTFDKRRKSEHLIDMLRSVISRLRKSMAAESFYVSLVSFAGNARAISIKGAAMAHISHAEQFITDPSFDYTSSKQGNGTNISAALAEGVKIIDRVLEDPKAAETHLVWHALIILITDGKDNFDTDAIYNVAGNVAVRRTGLEQGTIRLSCVAIGDDCDLPLLSDIASEADEQVYGQIMRAGKVEYLQKRPDAQKHSLVIHVNANQKDYFEVVRMFVDIVSQTLGR